MSMHEPRFGDYPIPEETEQTARAAFPNGNLIMQLRDEFGMFYQNDQFAALYSHEGQPALAPARLALITILQFMDGVSDRQAADNVRDRLSWKYVLGLPLNDPGFDHTVLSEFRTRLIAGGAEEVLLETLLDRFQQQGLLKPRGKQRTDSTHVLAAVRTLNRLERVGETLRYALNSVALVAPDWLRSWVPAAWFDEYGKRIDNYQLPKTDREREVLAAAIGKDGFALLDAIKSSAEWSWLTDVPAVKILRQVWADQYTAPPAVIAWRLPKEMPLAGQQIASPYDPQARWSGKRDVEWLGYKVHLTETCDDDLPRIITHVETTVATTPDDQVVAKIHADLRDKQRLPSQHLVDTGYTDAELLATSRTQDEIDLIGPVAADPSWQARAGTGFNNAAFQVNWDSKQVTCPQGQTSSKWIPGFDPAGAPVVKVHFARSTCLACPVRTQCTKGKIEPRSLTLREKDHYLALQTARQRQQTEEFKAQYATRAGIEATLGQGLRRSDLRQARYIGLAKTHLQHLITAAALNLIHLGEWLTGTPFAKTRLSPFAALKPAGPTR
jgi:transposase